MVGAITRRQAALLLARALVARPIVAASNRARVPNSSPEANDPSLDTDREGLAPVYVVLWFDTEDYILPASDDGRARDHLDLHLGSHRPNRIVIGSSNHRVAGQQKKDHK